MESTWERFEKGVQKLKNNETQMTDDQKKQYEKPLRKLKLQIKEDAEAIGWEFLIMGIRTAKIGEEEKQLAKRVQEEIKKGQKEINAAFKRLLTTYEPIEFINGLVPLQNRIFYQAYGPYWLDHCSENPMSKEYPYHNDLIDMDWWAEANEWAKTMMQDGKLVTDYKGGVTVMLPPTKELLQAEFERETKRQ